MVNHVVAGGLLRREEEVAPAGVLALRCDANSVEEGCFAPFERRLLGTLPCAVPVAVAVVELL